jgi:NAD+ kinase
MWSCPNLIFFRLFVIEGTDPMRVLVVHKNDLRAHRLAKELSSALLAKGISVNSVESHQLKINSSAPLDMVFVLGGDGTLLKTARYFASHETPIIGVNLGTVGFLSSIEPEDLICCLNLVLQGEYEITKRMMINVQLLRDALGRPHQALALNDAVIKTRVLHTIKIKLWVDGLLYTTFQGDGVICATPTGSTAYSLSAGGPILDPGISALVITPICPQFSSSHPLVIRSSSQLDFELESDYVTCLNIDGEEEIPILKGDIIRITQSPVVAEIIQFDPVSNSDKVAHWIQQAEMD